MFPCRELDLQGIPATLSANILPICFDIFVLAVYFQEPFFTDILMDASYFMQDTGLDDD